LVENNERECKRTDDFVKEFSEMFTPRKNILKIEDKMLRQTYTFKNYIIHKECDYRATIVRIQVHYEICSI